MFIKRLLAVFAISTGSASALVAQTIDINPLRVEGLVIGNKYIMDAEFSAQHNIPVPAPFEFIAPTSDDYQLYIQPAPGGTGIFKIYFVDANTEVLSNLQFVPMRVTNTDMQAQLDGLKALVEQAFTASIAGYPQSELLKMQITNVNDMPALEAIGRYDAGEDGIVILRVIAIPNPNGVDGIIAIINALTKNSNMDTIADIFIIEASQALDTFQFR